MITFCGSTIPGHGRGKGLGVPTINLRVEENCPANGIYAARVRWGSQTANGALHIGPRPTFHEDDVSVEVHLLLEDRSQKSEDGGGQNFPSLGDTVEVEVVGWIRDVEKFDSSEALKKAIQQDIVNARTLLEPNT